MQKFQLSVVTVLETVMVAFFLVIASRYWAVSEHVAFITLFSATAIVAITRGDPGPPSLRRYLPLVAFVSFLGWVVLSSAWSGNFHLSLGRAVTFGLVAAIGIAIGFALKPQVVAAGLILGVLFLVVHASLISGWHPFRAFLPPRLLSMTASAEPGLFTNVSSMTFLLGVGLVSSLSLSVKSKLAALYVAPVALLFLLSAIGIPVSTMFLAFFAALMIVLMVLHLKYSNGRLRKFLRIGYPVAVVFSLSISWVFRETLLRLIGEGPDLSGRVIIWGWYLEAFLWEPWIGIGWGNTYRWPLKPGDTYPTGEYFIAHNGFLDIGLATGGVGVILILTTLILLFLRGLALALDRAKAPVYALIPALVLYLAVNDVASTSLPRHVGAAIVGILVGLVVGQPENSDSPDAFGPSLHRESGFRKNRAMRHLAALLGSMR